jgi:butyrate kinase
VISLKIFVLLSRTNATEIAVFDDLDEIMRETVGHSLADLHSFQTPAAQGQYRFNSVLEALDIMDYPLNDVTAVITQIPSLVLPPGIYLADGKLLGRLSDSVMEENHFRAGVFAAYYLSEYINEKYGVENIPLVMEPALANEITQENSMSGLRGLIRIPRFNALSQRVAVANFAWGEYRKRSNDVRVIVVHLGREISVCAYDMGRIIDCNSPQDGEGPFSPTTCGALPLDALIDLCYSGIYDMDEIIAIISQKSGLSAYMKDVSLERVSEEYRSGNKRVVFLVKAMAFKVAREIAARAAALDGKVQAVLLTGHWGTFPEFVEEIASRASWIAPVKNYVTKGELWVLAGTALQTYAGGIEILLYGSDRK